MYKIFSRSQKQFYTVLWLSFTVVAISWNEISPSRKPIMSPIKFSELTKTLHTQGMAIYPREYQETLQWNIFRNMSVRFWYCTTWKRRKNVYQQLLYYKHFLFGEYWEYIYGCWEKITNPICIAEILLKNYNCQRRFLTNSFNRNHGSLITNIGNDFTQIK